MSRPVLACRPVVPNDMERALSAQTGIDIADPYPDSIEKPCQGCERSVWVGPRQQAVVDIDDTALVFCMGCAVHYAAQVQGFSMDDVYSLDNKHPREP